MTETSLKKIRTIPGRMSCTYAEAVYLLHQKLQEDDGGPTALQMAAVVAAIYGRETLVVWEDIKRGVVP